jgi:Recombination enhancement, RecA-dependent nuclease
MDRREEAHILRVKNLPCGVCGEGVTSDAHHLLENGRRVSHYAIIPLCKSCHQDGHNGIHGRAAIWKVMKKTELSVLAETIEVLMK